MTGLSRRTFLAGAGGLVAAIGVSACGDSDPGDGRSSGDPAGLGELTLQLNWLRDITFGGDYVMVDRGFAQSAGFDGVELMVGGPSIAAEPIVATGRARFGYSSPELTAAAREGGARLKIIGVGYQRNPFTIVSPADHPIDTPAALAGRTVAVDDVNQVVFSSFLHANGIDESKVEVVPANFDTSLLTSREVDAYLGYVANEAITFELAGLDTAHLDLDDHGLPDVGQAYITTERLLDDQPETVTAALGVFVRGWRAYFGDLADGIDVSLRNFDPDTPADPDFVRRSAEAYRDNFVTDDTREHGLLTLTESRMEAVVEGLAVGGIRTRAADLFDLSLLSRLYADEPELKALAPAR